MNSSSETSPLLPSVVGSSRLPGGYRSSNKELEDSILDDLEQGLLPLANEGKLELGNYRKNLTRAQQILNAASEKKYIMPRCQQEVGPALAKAIGGLLQTALIQCASSLLLGPTSGTADMVKMNAISEGVKGLLQPVELVAEKAVQDPSGDELAALVMREALSNFRKDLIPLLKEMPESMRDGLSFHLEGFEEKLRRYTKGSPYNLTGTDCRRIWDKLVRMISLPVNGRNVYQHDLKGDERAGRAIDKKQAKELKNFPEPTKTLLSKIIDAHRHGSINQAKTQPFHIFQGPPAVGKTFAAEAIARALGGAIIKASEDDLCEFLSVPIEGKKLQSQYHDDVDQWIPDAGKIWHTLVQGPTNANIVLLVDEVELKENKLMPALKRWMTGEDPIFPGSRGIAGAPKFTLIMASNEDIFSKFDPALQSRVTTCIRFSDWPREDLSARAHAYLESEIQERKEKFKPEALEKTASDTKQVLESMLAEERKYGLGVITLRHLHNMIRTTLDGFQSKNDREESYSIDETIQENAKKFAAINNHSSVKKEREEPNVKPIDDMKYNPRFSALMTILHLRRQFLSVKPWLVIPICQQTG